MLRTLTFIANPSFNVSTFSFFALDPLEQFDVLSLLPTGSLTNLWLLLALNFVLMEIALGLYTVNVRTNYDFVLRALYQLVRGVVKENLYIRKQQYFSVIFYLFLTILLANLAGMIPFSFTITSSFVVTFFLAATHFIGINHIAVVKHQWQTNDLFLPSGAPLAIAPFLIFIEAVSYIARVFSLSIRLFANMMSGHALLKILIGFSWVLLNSGTGMVLLALAPWGIVTAIMFLELLIAFLQAYVFTILVTLYINDVLNMHD
jgi:ATP synthase subunit 6